VDLMSIGEFARRSGLSANVLRLHDELELLPPARVDASSGYRFYGPAQLEQARRVAALRQLQIPLAGIKAILGLEPAAAAERIGEYWATAEAEGSQPDCDFAVPIRLTGNGPEGVRAADEAWAQAASERGRPGQPAAKHLVNRHATGIIRW
jgi:DNA-binding transcriptional MerR regulator